MAELSNSQADGTEDIPYPGVGAAFEILDQQKAYLNRQLLEVSTDIENMESSIDRAKLKKRELQQSLAEINVALSVLSTLP